MNTKPYGFPEYVMATVNGLRTKCKFLGLVRDEMHPDEFRYVKVRVQLLSGVDESWMDEMPIVKLSQLKRVDQQSLQRAWRMEREMAETLKNPVLASLIAS